MGEICKAGGRKALLSVPMDILPSYLHSRSSFYQFSVSPTPTKPFSLLTSPIPSVLSSNFSNASNSSLFSFFLTIPRSTCFPQCLLWLSVFLSDFFLSLSFFTRIGFVLCMQNQRFTNMHVEFCSFFPALLNNNKRKPWVPLISPT